jgi:hypothetical protein
MNTTPKTEVIPLWEIARFSLLICILGFAAFSAIAVGFAHTLTPRLPEMSDSKLGK